MKNRKVVTVSSLGFPQLSYPVKHGRDAVKAVMEHLAFQLSFVLPNHPDLIIFPEACDRYSTHTMAERKSYYEYRGDQILDYLAAVARENRCYIAYSAARLQADGSYRNTTELLDREGNTAGSYNKNHCVVTEISDGGILCGKSAPVIETDFGRVGMVICFDLNFDELRRKYFAQQPDLLLFSSMYHGGLMQNYWAYSVGSYLVSAVSGEECAVINPAGEKVSHSTNYSPYLTASINLDFQQVHLDFNWDKLKAAKARYGNGVTIFDPGRTGVVLLSSNLPALSSLEICREFEIELWRDYYNRSMAARHANIEP